MKIRNGNGNGHQIYLSQIKLDVLKFIKRFIEQHEYSPTYKEFLLSLNFLGLELVQLWQNYTN